MVKGPCRSREAACDSDGPPHWHRYWLVDVFDEVVVDVWRVVELLDVEILVEVVVKVDDVEDS